MPATSSVLAQKIERAKLGVSSAEGLQSFAAEIGRVASETACDLLDGAVEAKAEGAGATLPEALSGEVEPSVFYWLAADGGKKSILAVISPQFASVITERLLGGDLIAPPDVAASSVLDYQMAGSLADLLNQSLNELFAKKSPLKPNPYLKGKRGARTAADAVAGLEPTGAFCVRVSFTYGEHEAADAIKFYFLAKFVELAACAEFGRGQKKQAGAGAKWPERMRANVLRMELPLSVVLGRVPMHVGDLSKLEVGQTLDLDADALGKLELTASTEKGPATLAEGRLGTYQSVKAVKLTTPIDRDFFLGL